MENRGERRSASANGNPSDAELLAQWRRGDDRVLETIFDRYEQPLFLFLIGMMRDHHRAEDALQETFVHALQDIDSVDPEHFRGWLFTVAYHQAMLAKRKLASQQRHFPAEKADFDVKDRHPAADAIAVANEEAGWCRDLLNQLPDQQREVIRLRVYEGKRFRDIAAALGCPLNTALARMHQGLKRLRLLGGEANG